MEIDPEAFDSIFVVKVEEEKPVEPVSEEIVTVSESTIELESGSLWDPTTGTEVTAPTPESDVPVKPKRSRRKRNV